MTDAPTPALSEQRIAELRALAEAARKCCGWCGDESPDLRFRTTVLALLSDLASLRADLEAKEAALRAIDGEVSHGLMGDWSIALKAIRRRARAALERTPR